MKCEHCQQEVFDGTQHAPFNSEHKVCLVSAKQAVQSDVVKASADVIHSRASWSSTDRLADSTWVCGKATSFMFMPSGQHTICAGFRDGSIELSVNVTPETAKRVQASLDAWRAERPRQQPFGCIEHREHEASVCVTASCGFEWKEDGVYLTAEPTSLGANNVNGKVHRSWSPSFTTDADYAKASRDVETNCLRFPDGVRGSKSNPAEITGIDFCLGTLTNRPAFIEMKPVKGSEKAKPEAKSEKPEALFNRVLASEKQAAEILAKFVERNKPPVVTIEQINERFGKTKTGDTRQTPDEILAKIYARSGASR